jgi:hypothetical protein
MTAQHCLVNRWKLLPERFRHRHVELSTRMMGEGRDLFGLRKDGTEFPLGIGLNPIDIDGKPMVLAAIIDVTGRRKIELEKEQQQRQELARSNADLDFGTFLATILYTQSLIAPKAM